MLNIYRHSLSRSRGQILGWGLILALYIAYMVGFYENLLEMRATFESMLENYPPELLALVGGMDDLFSPGGYLHTYVFSYMPIILGIYAILAGSGLLIADEESGRLDLILGHPVSRTSLFFGRLLALATAMLLIVGLIWLGGIATLGGSTMDLSAGRLILPLLSLFGTLAFFATLALLFSMLLASRKMAGMVAGALLVASFLITNMATLNEQISTIADFSPLTYYQGGAALKGMEWGWLALLMGASLLFSLLAWWRFQRREIRVAGEGGWQVPRLRLRRKRSESMDTATTLA